MWRTIPCGTGMSWKRQGTATCRQKAFRTSMIWSLRTVASRKLSCHFATASLLFESSILQTKDFSDRMFGLDNWLPLLTDRQSLDRQGCVLPCRVEAFRRLIQPPRLLFLLYFPCRWRAIDNLYRVGRLYFLFRWWNKAGIDGISSVHLIRHRWLDDYLLLCLAGAEA